MNSSIAPRVAAMQAAVRVAEHQSFAAAARALGLSASAVSKAVSGLEQQLGVKLFQRTTRSVRLTPDGDRFLFKARLLLAELDELVDEASADAARVGGALRITLPESFGRHVITPLIAGFLRSYPEVRVELDFTDRYVDLAADPFDLAIRSGKLGDSTSLVARPLLRDPLVVVTAAEHAAAIESIDQPGELRRYDAVIFRNARTGRDEPWRFKGNTVVRPRPGAVVSDVEAALRLVVDGLGLAQVPLYLARPALESKRVVELLPDHRPEPTRYSAVYLDRRLLAANIRAFVDFVAASIVNSAQQTVGGR